MDPLQQQTPPQQLSGKGKAPIVDRARRAPIYELGKEGHYGACQQIVSAGHAPNADGYIGAFANVTQGLQNQYREVMATYWQATLQRLEEDEHDYKTHQLPLARIKKVMKADPEVKMISAEAPILFAKGCDIFITELTMRAWIFAEENKRRTLQRSDIASALLASDMFDFLIDIVPREEGTASSHSKRQAGHANQGQVPAQSQQVPQQAVQQQVHHPQHPHHPQAHEYAAHFAPPPMHPDQDGRYAHPMYVAQQHPDPAAYGQPPPQMFDQSMYAGYPMPPQQMYQLPQRGSDPHGGSSQQHHHQQPYRTHHGGGVVDDDAEGDREYDVG